MEGELSYNWHVVSVSCVLCVCLCNDGGAGWTESSSVPAK